MSRHESNFSVGPHIVGSLGPGGVRVVESPSPFAIIRLGTGFHSGPEDIEHLNFLSKSVSGAEARLLVHVSSIDIVCFVEGN